MKVEENEYEVEVRGTGKTWINPLVRSENLLQRSNLGILSFYMVYCFNIPTIENRIYIRGEIARKKCKTAILLYRFHTAGVLHIFMLFNL